MTGFGLAGVLGGKMSGKLVHRMGPRKLLSFGLICATLADLTLAYFGNLLGAMIGAVALLGFGFIFTHSTLVTRATEFAQKARGAAMSLIAMRHFFLALPYAKEFQGSKTRKPYGFIQDIRNSVTS